MTLVGEPPLASGEELSAELLGLVAERDRLDAEIARVAGEWDTARGWEADGAASGAAWLAHQTRGRPSAFRKILRLAQRLRRSMPLAAEALEGGEISLDHAQVLSRAVAQSPKVYERDEEMLVEIARTLRPDQLETAIRHWRSLADPDGTLEDANKAHERRRLHASRSWGALFLDGMWADDDADLIESALDAYTEAEWRADLSLPLAERRTPAQQRADAFREMCRTAAAEQDTAAGRSFRPRGSFVVDADRAPDADPDWARLADPVWLATRRPLPQETLARLCCDTHADVAVFAGSGRVLHLGRSARNPSDAQHRALALRDGGCDWPGCDRPPRFCDAHHIIWWTKGGSTDLWNLLLLCKRHHRYVHEGGFDIRHRRDRTTIEFRRPDGTLIEERPWPSLLDAPSGADPP